MSDELHNLLSKLHGVRQSGANFSALCPAHEDRTPSLSISVGKEQPVVLYCQVGCDQEAILAAAGTSWEELCKPRDRRDKPVVIATYEYTDEQGTVLYVKERRLPKDFRVKRPDGRGGWSWSLGDTRRVLYRLPEVLAAVASGRVVYVVEGEKDVHAAEAAGAVATCNFDGAAKPNARPKWRSEYGDTLKGAHVVIVADHDEAGISHAQAVLDDLQGKAASVRIVRGLVKQAHADLSDHLAAGHTIDQLVPLDLTEAEANESDHNQPTAADIDEQNEEPEDRFPRIDWKEAFATDFSSIDWLAGRFMEYGQQTGLVGPGKAGKSLFVDNWIWCAITGRSFLGDQRRKPIKVLYLDRENSLRDIVTRLTSLGATPEDLELLDYRMFPRFSGGLDASAIAAEQLLALVEESQPDVVVLDTVSRYISGKENDSDTWLDLYRRVHVPLKALNIGCFRLDHMGKDEDRGSRGSSAKTQDVDHVWELTKLSESKVFDPRTGIETITTQLKMNRTHTRSGLGEDLFLITRRGLRQKGGMWLPGGTSHELSVAGFLDNGAPAEGTAEWLVQQLDKAKADTSWGSPRVITWCRERGIKMAKSKMEEAAKIRKNRTQDLPAHLPYPSVTTTPPESGGGEGISPGQTSPGEVGGSSGEAPSGPPSPRPLSREGGGRSGQLAKDGESAPCGGCGCVMTIVEPGQLWHHRNKDCERLYYDLQNEDT